MFSGFGFHVVSCTFSGIRRAADSWQKGPRPSPMYVEGLLILVACMLQGHTSALIRSYGVKSRIKLPKLGLRQMATSAEYSQIESLQIQRPLGMKPAQVKVGDLWKKDERAILILFRSFG